MDDKTALCIALFILSIFLIISLVFGCRTQVSENFKVGSFPPAPSVSAKSRSKTASKEQEQEQEQEEEEEAQEEEDVDEDEEEEEDKSNKMSSTEKELFKQITTNKISTPDLEKLIKAGVVTEKMIEKFLERIDNGDTVEPFCSGENSGCALE